MMFENKKFYDIHATRYIVSWRKAGGDVYMGTDSNFDKWLKSLGLTDDERYHIIELATCGKMELENDARTFIKQHTNIKEES